MTTGAKRAARKPPTLPRLAAPSHALPRLAVPGPAAPNPAFLPQSERFGIASLADLDPADNPDTPIEQRPGKISWIRRQPHYGFAGPIPGVLRGERVFAASRHHDHYSILIESETDPRLSRAVHIQK